MSATTTITPVPGHYSLWGHLEDGGVVSIKGLFVTYDEAVNYLEAFAANIRAIVPVGPISIVMPKEEADALLAEMEDEVNGDTEDDFIDYDDDRDGGIDALDPSDYIARGGSDNPLNPSHPNAHTKTGLCVDPARYGCPDERH